MGLTEVETEKVPGRITHVYIGKDKDNGVDIKKGIKLFSYARVHDAKTAFNAANKTAPSIFQPRSNFTWRLEFLSDCRTAFFATDVGAAEDNQYALVNNGDSNEIEYFKVVVPIVDGSGADKTRTYTISKGYALRNGCERIGDDEDAVYWYEGIAEYISYSDV